MEYIKAADDGDGCVFCLAASGDDAERLVVHRGAHAIVLLNKFPYSSGHFMVAPVRHVGEYGELTDDEVLELHRLASAGMGALAGDLHAAGLQPRLEPRPHRRRRRRRPRAPARRSAWAGDTNFMPVLADVKVLPEHLEETRAEAARRLAGV
jgi:ATP adenylyltransferase